MWQEAADDTQILITDMEVWKMSPHLSRNGLFQWAAEKMGEDWACWL